MKTVILFGGQSYEHEISIVSSIAMKDVLKKQELIYIYVDAQREMYHIPTDIIKSKLFSSGEYKKFDKVYFKKNGFYKKTGFIKKDKVIDYEIVLNLSHGGDGEDGVFAGLFEFYNIPFIGPRVEACSVSSNKFLTKGYANSVGVKVVDYDFFYKGDDKNNIDSFPVIIKPAKLGSSIGVAIVKNREELQYALDVAYEFDDSVVVEPFMSGVKEYNLAGTKIGNEFKFSIVEEPQKADFLDFDKKYLDFSRTSTASKAPITKELEIKIQDSFKKLYNNLFNGSIIRCDFFVIEGEVYLNEINSVPGSMANYLFEDFEKIFLEVAKTLPSKKNIPVTYEYVNKIHANKGK